MWFRKKIQTFEPLELGGYIIKEVPPKEWPAFRAFYLRALKEHPGSSSESYEEKKTETPEQWEEMLTESWNDPRSAVISIIHKASGSLVGFVRVAGTSESKLSHEAHVRSFYLAPEHANDELLTALWQALMKHFKQFSDINKIKIAVLTADRGTVTLFNRLGFVRYGYDETYFRIGKKYVDAILMFHRI